MKKLGLTATVLAIALVGSNASARWSTYHGNICEGRTATAKHYIEYASDDLYGNVGFKGAYNTYYDPSADVKTEVQCPLPLNYAPTANLLNAFVVMRDSNTGPSASVDCRLFKSEHNGYLLWASNWVQSSETISVRSFGPPEQSASGYYFMHCNLPEMAYGVPAYQTGVVSAFMETND